MLKIQVAIGAFILGLIVFWSSFFLVREGQQAIITQFGKPVGNPITASGPHFKMPFTQEVRFVEKKILSWDGYPNQIPTKDKKYIHVDTTARWKVIDALKFIQTVQNETGAKGRLDAILDAATRDTISNHNLVEAVRNSNTILEELAKQKSTRKKNQEEGIQVVEEEFSGEIESIQVGREQLSQLIAQKASKELKEFGIELIDVQLKRISYEKSVQRKVYERMISERQRIAEKIRSIGKGEKAKIEGRLTKDLQQIESAAYKKAQVVRGEGEAKAVAIFARALSADPSFYEFMRSMEAYKSTFKDKGRFIFSSSSEFFKKFKRTE